MENNLKFEIYKFCRTKNDVKKADSIIDLIERGVINQENYWSKVNTFIKNCKSIVAINRWKEIASFIENLLYN